MLSIFGLGQNHTHAASGKYVEASRLNAEFELNLNSALNLLRSEQLHLRQRISDLCALPEDEDVLLGHVEPLIERMIFETEVGLATAQNTQKTIASSSRFTSLRKWDECISILYKHVASSRQQLERIETALAQLHRILDNAQTNIPELDFDVVVEAMEKDEEK